VPSDWPNRTASRLVHAAGLQWHVQDMGFGPPLLLIHGTGSAGQSWRDVAPLLAGRFRVIVPDLPGHGFTSSPDFARFSLPGMADSMRGLLSALGVKPAVVVGHSAGAAVLVQMALNNYIAPRVIISVNGALLPLAGMPRWIFSPLAQVLARTSLVPRLLAVRAANTNSIRRLIEDTGSRLDAEGIRLYQELVKRPTHVAAALAMMANWNLNPLVADLGRLRTSLKLLVASRDRTISPATADRVCERVPSARIVSLGHFGHLAHEEQPRAVSAEITRLARESEVPSVLAGSATEGEPSWQQYLMQS
jgi:magnesium chelatase accessory protein